MKYQDLEVFRRTSNVYELFFTTDGQYEDITGWTVYFTVKESQKDSDSSAIIQKDITSHIDGEHGRTEIVLTPEDTDITSRVYWYDIVVKDDEDNINVVSHGRLKVVEHATDRA
jgi:hypothetical protein